VPEQDEELVREMVRLAFRFESEETERYLSALKERLRKTSGSN
jgi:hypothetical protein